MKKTPTKEDHTKDKKPADLPGAKKPADPPSNEKKDSKGKK